jgi:hypothetical protein
MPPSADILRTIEEISGEDEKKMQQSFNDYDKCSGISKKKTASMIFIMRSN